MIVCSYLWLNYLLNAFVLASIMCIYDLLLEGGSKYYKAFLGFILERLIGYERINLFSILMAWEADSLAIFLTSEYTQYVLCLSVWWKSMYWRAYHIGSSLVIVEGEILYRILNLKKNYSNLNFIIYLQEFSYSFFFCIWKFLII